MAQQETFRDLYIEQLRDIYNAEQQLIKALPKMAKASTSDELRGGFEEHLEQTREHAQRLEQIFQAMGEKPTGTKCKAMEGLVEEGGEAIDSDYGGEVKDAALIAAAQRVEHYEMAAYGTAKAFAELLGESNAVKLLNETFEEEKETDQKLTELSATINSEANGQGSEDNDEGNEATRLRVMKAKAGRS
jgi:ferritin-like metal-binding protein YciE